MPPSNSLNARGRPAAVKAIFGRVRTYILAAATELAAREAAEAAQQLEFHRAKADDETESETRRVAFKTALTELERAKVRDAADYLASDELPALAALLSQQADADVDQAGSDLLRFAGFRRRQGTAPRRTDRRSIRQPGDGRRDLHAQAVAPGGRQDSRPVAPGHTRWYPAAVWPVKRSSAASGSERWRCGRWKLRRGIYPSGDPDRQVG